MSEGKPRHTLSSTLAAAIAGNTRAIVKGKNIARRSVFAADQTRLDDISGYLMKKSTKGVYQRRFFFINNAYLIYKQKQVSRGHKRNPLYRVLGRLLKRLPTAYETI